MVFIDKRFNVRGEWNVREVGNVYSHGIFGDLFLDIWYEGTVRITVGPRSVGATAVVMFLARTLII